MGADRIPLIDELSRTDRDIIAIQHELDQAKRARLVEDFLKSRDGLFKRIARTQIRKYRSLSPINDIDDVTQVVRDIALSMVEGTGYAPFSGLLFEVVLQNRSHTAVQSYARRSGASNSSGDTEARKRHNDWQTTQEELIQTLQRMPTDEEVNARYRELYSVYPGGTIDAELRAGSVKQMGVTLTDATNDAFFMEDGNDPENTVVSGAADIIEALIQECAAVSDELATYAKAWLTSVVEDTGKEGIQAQMKLSRVKAAKLDRQLKDVMSEYILSQD